MRRAGHRKGEWLIIDDESGLTRYASQTTEDYYGRRIDKRWKDEAHPQDFIRARDDPRPLPYLRSKESTSGACAFYPRFVGNTDIPTSTIYRNSSPAYHLFDPGIGEMDIGCSFTVR